MLTNATKLVNKRVVTFLLGVQKRIYKCQCVPINFVINHPLVWIAEHLNTKNLTPIK